MRSVRARLVALNILLLALILVGMGFALRQRIRANLLDAVDQELSSAGQAVSTTALHGESTREMPLVKRQKVPEIFEQRTFQQHSTAPSDSLNVTLPAAKGPSVMEVVKYPSTTVRFEANPSIPRLLPVPLSHLERLDSRVLDEQGYLSASTGKRTFHDFENGRTPLRSLSLPVFDRGQVVAVVQDVRSLASLRSQMVDLDRGLEMVIPLAVLVAAMGGAVFVGATVRPIRRLIDSAKQLDPHLSGSRLPSDGGDEFAELADAFNEAFDRSAAAFVVQQRAMAQLERFTGDAGHELRSPLGALKGSASYLLLRGGLDDDAQNALKIVDRSVDRMSRLIDDLLLLARQDGSSCLLPMERVEMTALVSEVTDDLTMPDSVELDWTPVAGLEAMTEPESFKRIVSNLLRNAAAYARSRVSVSVRRRGDFLELGIWDDGEGIAPEHLVRLGERFYRPDDARSRQQGGTGLGLAIVKSLCASLQIEFVLESAVGEGTSAVLRIPAPNSS